MTRYERNQERRVNRAIKAMAKGESLRQVERDTGIPRSTLYHMRRRRAA